MNKKINLAISFLAAFILIAAATGPYFASSAHAQDIQGLLDTVIQAPHRSEVNRARDQYRHPKETLLFFGLRSDMTVVEISPANGWYTEIIGPLLKKKGAFLCGRTFNYRGYAKGNEGSRCRLPPNAERRLRTLRRADDHVL